jgi:hypothetical protein
MLDGFNWNLRKSSNARKLKFTSYVSVTRTTFRLSDVAFTELGRPHRIEIMTNESDMVAIKPSDKGYGLSYCLSSTGGTTSSGLTNHLVKDVGSGMFLKFASEDGWTIFKKE